MEKKIVVAGAGYTGVLTAKKIAKYIKKSKLEKQVEISVIDQNPFHTLLTELHEVAAWRVGEDSVKISLNRIFEGRGVKVIMDTVQSVDYGNQRVVCENAVLPYDYLVLATGSQPAFYGVEGAGEHVFTLWSYDDAVILREHILKMFRLATRVADPQKKRALLTFVVVGGGLTGVEMAGELSELIPFLCDRFEIPPDFVTLLNMDALDKLCVILPDRLSNKIRRRLEKKRVQVLLGAEMTYAGADYVEYRHKGATRRLAANTVIWTAGVEGSGLAKDSSEALGGAPRGRIQTDAFLRAQNHADVYVGGDNLYWIPEGTQSPVPQMVENCEASAGTIAHNLLCDLTGAGEYKKYAPKFHGVMVSVGGRYAVAHVGLPGKWIALPSFLAMLAKHFINLVYFIQVLGWNKVFSYIRHEFFTIRDCRSFLGGHFSNRSPSFFLVPLRLYLGFCWLYEGIAKVREGWFSKPRLADFFTGADQFYQNLLNTAVDATSSASGAPEAVTSASGEAAASAGSLIFSFDLLNQFRFILVNAGEYAFKIQVGIVDFILNQMILPFSGVQMFFQVMIVLAEILIGLALLGGLFTTPASAASLFLQFLFLTSTGLYMSSWWMFFAGIAMLFGGGRVLSLDYYAMPWLKKKWKNVRFARKWYLYHD